MAFQDRTPSKLAPACSSRSRKSLPRRREVIFLLAYPRRKIECRMLSLAARSGTIVSFFFSFNIAHVRRRGKKKLNLNNGRKTQPQQRDPLRRALSLSLFCTSTTRIEARGGGIVVRKNQRNEKKISLSLSQTCSVLPSFPPPPRSSSAEEEPSPSRRPPTPPRRSTATSSSRRRQY